MLTSNASEILNRRKTSGPPTLTGSDLKSNSITLTIIEVTETPAEWTAPLKMQFKPSVKSVDKERGEIDVLGLNQTNSKALIALFGPDMNKWRGKHVTFGRLMTQNPKTGKMVWGLRVIS